MVRFRVTRRTYSVQALLPAPEFSFMGHTWLLHEALYRSFLESGAKLGALHQEGSEPGTFACRLDLLHRDAQVSVGLDKIELRILNVGNTGPDAAIEMLGKLIHELKSRWSHLTVAGWGVTEGLHGTIPDTPATSAVLRTLAPPDLGEASAAVWRCTYTPQSPGLAWSVQMENSLLVQEGVYLQIESLWDASRSDLEAVGSASRNLRQKVLDLLSWEANDERS